MKHDRAIFQVIGMPLTQVEFEFGQWKDKVNILGRRMYACGMLADIDEDMASKLFDAGYSPEDAVPMLVNMVIA